MGMLFSFAPFIAFALLDRVLGVLPALGVATALAVVLLLRDLLSKNRSVKLLEIGTAALFGGLALYAVITQTDWSLLAVRLRVDAGLFLVVLASIAVRRPFTLQYAKEQTSPEVWMQPAFLKVNNVITAAWAVAFAFMVLADIAMLYVPSVPTWIGITVTVTAIVGAIKFTRWYPDYVRAHASIQN